MDIYFRTTGDYEIREEKLYGDDYIVVPVVMMAEGVHSGSHGAILHTAEELGRFPQSWDGIPVTIGHPKVEENYVSANSPSVLTAWSVGTIFNTRMEDGKLKAEAWINVEDVTSIHPETLERIKNKEIMEVSVGVFSDEERESGSFGGENYVAIAHNHRPDHLALLPDEVGACSIEDGCGIRVNKKGGVKMFVLNKDNEREILKALAKSELIANETGFGELRNKAQMTLDNKDGNGFSYYLEELFGDYLVYRETHYNNDYSNRTTKLFKQSYQENAAGDVEFTGEAVQVKREVSYSTVPQTNGDGDKVKRTRTKFNNNQKQGEMPKDCQVCKDKTTALINNSATPYTEDDRAWMEALEVNQLDKLTPKVVEKEVPGVVTNAQVMAAFKESMKTPEDFLGIMPKEIRDQFQTGLNMQTNAKNQMVKGIMDNTDEGVWTKEELEALPTASVTKIYKSLAIDTEGEAAFYVGSTSTPHVNAEEEVEVMAPIGVNFKTVKN